MSEIVVTKYDQGRIIEAQKGDMIVFHLEENLTTGYGWEIETVEDSVVELIESTYNRASEMAIGGGGMRVMRFVVRSPGSQNIRLRLRRQWEPPDRVLEYLKVTIRVR